MLRILELAQENENKYQLRKIISAFHIDTEFVPFRVTAFPDNDEYIDFIIVLDIPDLFDMVKLIKQHPTLSTSPILYFKDADNRTIVDQLNIGNDLIISVHSSEIDISFQVEYFIRKCWKAPDIERELLSQLMNNIPDTIYFKNNKKKFIRINKAQAKLFGIDNPDDAIGKTDLDFFGEEMAKKTSKDEDEIINGGMPLIDVEELVNDFEGNTYWMSVTKNAIRDKFGNITGIVGISRDISQRKETEKQLKHAKYRAEQADMLKSAFLANMSHEIRTPMNTIIGFSELLKNQMLSLEERIEYLDYITEGGNSLLNLIDDIIDFAKIESGQIAIKKSACHVNMIIEDVLQIYTREKVRKGKDEIRIISDTPVTNDDFAIYTDQNRFKQVLSNIVQNALKFTDKGYIKIGYTIDESEILFYVKDTGVGIEKDKQDIVFDRFGQVDSSLTRNVGGTGLGLAISKSIIELLGGSIRLESSFGRGTTFFFTLPFEEVKKDKVSTGDLVELDSYSPNWDGKIFLIAEDEDNNFRFLEAILKVTNAIILRAHNGKELIEMIKNSEFIIDIVLCDLKMPKMDGYTAINIIRNELKSEIPVIAQTAYAIIGEKQKCLDIGFTDYLSKPINVKQLILLMRKYIS